MDPITTPAASPLRPSRGRLSLVFLGVIAIGLIVGSLLRPEGGQADGQQSGLIGQPAPQVDVELFDGSRWTLSDHFATDGRAVVLNLWASWCIPCREEIPELDGFAAATPNVAVVGVAVNDTEDPARALFDELRPAYPMGMDASGSLRDRYPSFGLPFTVIIDADGIVRHEINGALTADRLAGYFD